MWVLLSHQFLVSFSTSWDSWKTVNKMEKHKWHNTLKKDNGKNKIMKFLSCRGLSLKIFLT